MYVVLAAKKSFVLSSTYMYAYFSSDVNFKHASNLLYLKQGITTLKQFKFTRVNPALLLLSKCVIRNVKIQSILNCRPQNI